MRASSYVGKTTEANVEEVQLTTIGGQALNVKDRHVIIVEDIVDTGMTMLRTVSHLKKIGGAASVTIATLLDKKAGRSRSRLLSKRSKEEGNDGHEVSLCVHVLGLAWLCIDQSTAACRSDQIRSE